MSSGATGRPEVADQLTDGHRAALLAWFGERGRDLPWRRTRDPWAVLVSEKMLQQTQVARVVPKYQAFLARFPTPTACAAVPAGDVVRLWAGLGYNRRALDVHRCAVAVCERHDGVLPADLDALLALPGIGPYTARAVLAFAYERRVGVVETNTARVLARWSNRTLRRTEVQALADAAVPADGSWTWNQAMVDLGATVCLRRSPRCDACPVSRWCAWARDGRPLPDPADGSAGTSGRQSRFAGSDRQGRGRLVDALRHGPVDREPSALARTMGWPDEPERATRVAGSVVADGLATVGADGRLHLP